MADPQKFRPKVTYLSTKETHCPICGKIFFTEHLQQGGGRLIAGEITDLLKREYKPSQTFGKIQPLVYSIIVCPDCFYASMLNDFDKIPEDARQKLKNLRDERINFGNKLVGNHIDFDRSRSLESGAVSFALAIECYDHFGKKSAPVIKQAICSMRAGFLFEELEKAKPDEYYGFLKDLFYKKALFFYKLAQELNTKKEQIFENIPLALGPDLDKNWSFDGITYLIAALTYIYSTKDDPVKRKKDLEDAKLFFGKLFGMGKSNIDKPKEILDKSKKFYEIISKELSQSDA